LPTAPDFRRRFFQFDVLPVARGACLWYSLHMHDLIIIGAGPAGLAASVYAARKRLNFLVLSKNLGGKSNYSIKLPEMEEHQVIRARELVTIYKSKLEYLRHSYRLEGVAALAHSDGVFTVTTSKGSEEQSRAVIVASGTRNRRLDVEGEGKFLSRGLGYSSISYSHLFEGKRVFLTGDTDRVLNSAIELSIHSEQVTLVLLKGGTYSDELKSYVGGLDRVSVIENATIKEFRGGDFANEAVVESAGGEQVIAADGFFVEPEPSGNTKFLEGVVDFQGAGYVPVNSSCMTSLPGLFAAGDVTGYCCEQVLVALGDGAKAALAAYRYLLRNGKR
jgi:alkyl hydroperoxide reductase subunit F